LPVGMHQHAARVEKQRFHDARRCGRPGHQ
jgi:hypothetical protein